MSKARSFAAVAASILVLTAAVLAPSVYLAFQESLLLGGQYERDILPVTIDPEAEEIYLVRAIRDAYYLGVGLPVLEEQRLRDEWAELAALVPELPALSLGQPVDSIEKARGASDGMLLSIHEFLWENGGERHTISVHSETKTGKLLYLAVQKNNGRTGAPGDTLQGHNSDAIARAFCSYLSLDILDDWSSGDGGLISEKAALKIVCQNSPDTFLLYVAPLEFQWKSDSSSQLIVGS